VSSAPPTDLPELRRPGRNPRVESFSRHHQAGIDPWLASSGAMSNPTSQVALSVDP
jgi:hypothetical protein